MNGDHKAFIKTSIENIKKAHNENYLSIFAGAGISVNSGLPTWSELINDISKELYGNGEYKEDNLVLAEKFYNQFGENYYYQKLNEFIPNNKQPNYLHKKIVRLDLENLITTNWDNLFEKAINEEGMFFNIIKSDEDFGNSKGYLKLIKMHGSLDKKNIVFKKQDYSEYSKNFPLIENYIKGVFSIDTVVLLGYSLSDQNVKQIIHWVNACSKTTKPIYFIKTGKAFDQNEFDFYKNKNIHILYLKELYNEEHHNKEIEHFLEEIKKKEEAKPIDALVLNNDEINNIKNILINFDDNALKERIEKLFTSTRTSLKDNFLRCFLIFENRSDDLIFENRSDDENLSQLYFEYKNISKEAFKQRKYQIWFLSEFNKYWGFTSYEAKEKYSNNDWEEKFLKLPSTQRDKLRNLSNLEYYFNKQLSSLYQAMMEIEKGRLYWKEGGFSCDNGSNLNKALQILTDFDKTRIGNCLSIPKFEEHRKVYKIALECYWCELSISFLRGKKEIYKINNEILSYTIRYFHTKELKNMFLKYFNIKEFKTYPTFETDQTFLQTIFVNICHGFKEYRFFTTRNSTWFNNFLRLVAYCKLTQETFNKIIEEFNKKMQERIVSLIQYEYIADFVTHQTRNKDLDFKKCLNLVLSFLQYFIEEKVGGYEFEAMPHFLNILKQIQKIDEEHENVIINFIDKIHQYIRISDDNQPNFLDNIPEEVKSELIEMIRETPYEYSISYIPFIKTIYQYSNKKLQKAIKEKLEYIIEHKEEYRQTKRSKIYCQWLEDFIKELNNPPS